MFKQFIQYVTVSWRLYNRLLDPPEHPVYWRTINSNIPHPLPKLILWLLWGIVVAVCSIVWWYLAQFDIPLPIIFPTVLSIFTSAYVSLWLVDISLTIARERHQATYDPLSMTPTGAFGANWAWVTGILHRHDRFAWVDLGRKSFTAFNLIIFCMAFMTITLRVMDAVSIQHIILLLEIALLTFITYADHMQGVVMGVLIALLLPHYIRNAVDIHIWTVFVYITLQVLVLTIVLTTYLMIDIHTGQSLLLLCLLYGLRGLLISGLWLLVSHNLNTD